MEVTVNGESIALDESLSLGDFLVRREIDTERVVVELNREIVETRNYASIYLKDKDILEILRFVGGG